MLSQLNIHEVSSVTLSSKELTTPSSSFNVNPQFVEVQEITITGKDGKQFTINCFMEGVPRDPA